MTDMNRTKFLAKALGVVDAVQVLDVGANPLVEGKVSYRDMLDAGLAEVTGFEPQAEALAALNVQKSDAETYLEYALGDGSEKTLHLYRSTGYTSVFELDDGTVDLLELAPGSNKTGEVPLKTHRLDQIDAVPQVDFLKIDVQGSETAILQNGREKLARAVAVQTEVRMFRLYEGEPRYGYLETELAYQGFDFLRFASLKHLPLATRYKRQLKRTEFAQAVDGDAYFVRDLRKLADYDAAQLRKLVLIADGIMDSADLALFALDQLVARGEAEADLPLAYLERVEPQRRRG